jgi:prepilin-type N-terminal cleavage/methylation domain-containing protein
VRRSGFTLIEVLVALSLSGLVVLLAHRVFTAVVDGSGRVREARQALDREANARRWLTDAWGSLAVGQNSGGFGGGPTQADFGAWLPTASRGFVSSRVVLGVHGSRLVAVLDGRDSVVLADTVGSAAFDYLLDPGANTRWVGTWLSPVTAPLAARIRLTRGTPSRTPTGVDTLLFLIGPRG